MASDVSEDWRSLGICLISLPISSPLVSSMFYELVVSTWGAEELEAIQRVIASNRFTIGPNVAAFEDAFAEYHRRKYAVMVNSGSSANLLCIAALFYKKNRPLQRGDEVIVPAISWATTYHPLQQYGLKLKIVDVELDTLNIDPRQVEACIGPRTRAIMGVSILGNPAALDVLRNLADARGLYFIEDNCESMDAEIAGRKAGTFGHLSTFSSFFSHHSDRRATPDTRPHYTARPARRPSNDRSRNFGSASPACELPGERHNTSFLNGLPVQQMCAVLLRPLATFWRKIR
jgi:hypothetical protein